MRIIVVGDGQGGHGTIEGAKKINFEVIGNRDFEVMDETVTNHHSKPGPATFWIRDQVVRGGFVVPPVDDPE